MFQFISFVVFIIVFDGLLVTTSATCTLFGDRVCSDEVQIDYPFWYGNSSEINYCGYHGLEIKCKDDDGRAVMNISDHLYYVQYINYSMKVLKLVDVDEEGQECPHSKQNFSLESVPPSLKDSYTPLIIFYNCSNVPDDRIFNNYERIPCQEDNSTVPLRSYAFYDYSKHYKLIPNWHGNCEETVLRPMPRGYRGNYTKTAKFGFDLSWDVPTDCERCETSDGNCYYDNNEQVYQCQCGYDVDARIFYCEEMPLAGWKAILIGVPVVIGGLLVSLFFLYKKKIFHSFYHLIFSRWRNETKNAKNVEMLLESYGCLALQRYKYSDIMFITNSFEHKLGQGGYGCVFKGTLHDGRLVAIKVLNESKGYGQDFINEVSTIGKTNHVNVVTLLGFCIEGNKRALVYEFMPNGSLERFIYNEKKSSTQSTHLGWEKLYQIALGIAKGLEYLHCGCNTRILHFDIKPHNILLDKDFFPKISDFGLAKLCLTRETIVSVVGARGTMGYIAPEISCRNLGLGGVSHKSDVYSYGMMVLEMVGGRKNLDVTVENMSGIYFPHWIYNQLKQDSKVEGPEVIKFEGAGEILKDATAKKMIIVALWCIQTLPTSRPSITKVVEMLEGSNEELKMPPNPSMDPPSIDLSPST
ncbi:Pr5-like receptor kinase [Thalictrum thalictroides]|uniref:non-specific serine/threonine protein kinase n=1 Tax=Thalictrum thalictroides TaxID=46969 RepID=A0A7J6V8Y5_THATH|nr:Pr5-like receptor kinase [Thalictrum thalictroides]